MDDSLAQKGTPDIPVDRKWKIGECCKIKNNLLNVLVKSDLILILGNCITYLTVQSTSL